MSVSKEYAESMAADAAKWWANIPPQRKLMLTGAATFEEADKRFNLISVASRSALMHGNIQTIADFNW